MRRSSTLAVVAVVAVVAVAASALGASAAVAAERPTLTDLLAARLGVSAASLRQASRLALVARVNAAVKTGKLTAEQGTRLKARIAVASRVRARIARTKPSAADNRVRVHGLSAAAAYLGLTVQTLRAHLQAGETLAQVAAASDKSVDGLVEAIVAKAKKRLDTAVADGRLTRKRANQILARVTTAAKKAVKAVHAGA